MKKTIITVAAALTVIMSLSSILGTTKLGPFGVDVVSAATGETETTPAANSTWKPSAAPAVVETSTEIKRFLAFGSYGGDVKLLQTMLNNVGYNLVVDGIFGKNTEAAVKDYQKKNSLSVDGVVGPKTLAKLVPASVKVVETAQPTAEKTTIKVGRADYAAHGTKCFTSAVVAMAGDKIVAASMDDYQFIGTDVAKGVPNSDKDFAANFADSKMALASKLTNAKYYSENMKTKGGATVPIDKNFDAILAYVKGKTIAQLEATLASSTPGQKVDAVSGATLTDTTGYLAAIVTAAKAAVENSPLQVETAALNRMKVGRVDFAAHGTKCFTSAVAVMIDDKIVATSVDDYQFMSTDVAKGVPNSDKDFGKNYKDPKMVLASKRLNTSYYSENMKTKGGATIAIDKNLDAVQVFAAGKTIAELEAVLSKSTPGQKIDAVSGATLADTPGYLSAIVAAAKASSKEAEKIALKVGRADYAAHGTKCFTSAVVAMAGDKIAAVSIDDYQFIGTDVAKGVPNSDKDFAANFADPKMALASKLTNAAYYSENMKTKGGATVPIDKNFEAVVAYVKGKTIAQLEALISKSTPGQKVDAVSGATLADTPGYLAAIVAAAKAAVENSQVKVETSALDKIKVGRVDYAAHGTKCFTSAVAIMLGDKIVATSIDDYQFMGTDVATGVPNSDKDFGKNYKDPKMVLASKRTNTKYYSENMKTKGGATIAIDKNLDAVQVYAAGKTIAELEAVASNSTPGQKVDAVSGATLADTPGYLSALVAAAKAAK
jgi:hypothetical protein